MESIVTVRLAAAEIDYSPFSFSTIAGIAGVKGSNDETAIDAHDAEFYYPASVAPDTNGNLYVADTFNGGIRKLAPDGTNYTVTTIAKGFNYPNGVGTDAAGNVYVADTLNGLVKKLSPSSSNWVVTTINGSYTDPTGVAVDSATNVYICSLNYTVQKVTPLGVVSTIAGQAGMSGTNDGIGTAAHFKYLGNIALDAATNIYLADSGNNTIRKVTPQGVVTTLAGRTGVSGAQDGSATNALFSDPQGVAVDAATNVYVADYGNQTIRKISPGGVVVTLGGLLANPGSVDAAGVTARFHAPEGVAVDSRGILYVADSQNDTIRRGITTPPVIVPGSLALTNGHFTFELSGPMTQPVIVQSSTNLQTWRSVWTNTLNNSMIQFTDPTAAVSHTFYRAFIP